MSTCFASKTADEMILYLGDVMADCSLPTATYPAQALSITAGAAATAAGATAITIVAVPAGVYIPPKDVDQGGWFLEFIAPGSTVPYLAELDNTAAIVAGATSLAVKALPQAIPANAVATWPVLVRGVTTRGYNRTINAVPSAATSKTGFAGSAPGTQTAQFDITVEVTDTAGYFNFRRLGGKRESGFGKLISPQTNSNIRAKVVQGKVYIGSLNESGANNAFPTMTTTMSFIDEPIETYGLAV
jgi:hypothetical protein